MKLTGAPAAVLLAYVSSRASQRKVYQHYREPHLAYQRETKKLKLSADWFTPGIPFWLAAIEEAGLHKRPIEALEIGSWEGLSAHFTLHTLPTAHLTCVDMWDTTDAFYASVARASGEAIERIETKFDANLVPFIARLSKYKGPSISFFAAHPERERYDLIYVDGSHHVDDVLVDAVRSFELLKVGGILILDDYFWQRYDNPVDNPAAAINAFLRLKSGALELLRVYDQVILRKTAADTLRPSH